MKSNTAKSPINILYKKKRREIRFFISGRMEKKKIDCFALKTWGHSFINIISLNCIVMCKRYNDSVYECFLGFFFTIQNINHYMAKKSPMVYKILYQYVILQWKKALLLQNYIIVVLGFQNRNRFFFLWNYSLEKNLLIVKVCFMLLRFCRKMFFK